ncbi:MAG: SpoIIE family protein phosphatase [Bacteroidaceae bacterium]|nr:SpoIIE family protein phosphatase [Bacteroidaceae bacterium]
MNILKKLWPKTLRSKSSVAIIVTVAVLLELISTIQFLYARKGIREEVEHRAETELRVKELEIQKVMVAVETAIGNTVWAAERMLERPDSLYSVLRRMVEQNPTIVGAGLMFKADYYPQEGHWFEPYVAQREDGSIDEEQIGSTSHNYLESEFYLNGISAGQGRWSEPYYDNAGAKMMLCTYTIPVHNKKGETVALLGADVSLDWLTSVINANRIYSTSYNVVISRTGQVLVGPEENLILRRTIQEITATYSDTMTQHINRQMLSGQSGHSTITGMNGEKKFVFYAPIDGETGWSMAVVCNDKEIYANLRKVILYLSLLMLAGLALLGYIIYRTARSDRSLQKANAEKERIGSELRIAREIQESMLPKTFPPYPDHEEIDIFASLVPAKEVGGDLYDYHIRDEKLFFCIGDVSGKGVPASLVMAVTRSLFRTVSAREDLPEKIVAAMNASMAETNDSDMFVTLFVGALDLQTGQLHYCNAGHEEPLLIGKGVGLLHADNNIPIGLMPEWNYQGQETLISGGATIFLYTDGLIEAENNTHSQYGKQRMTQTARQILNDCNSCSPETIIEHQAKALHQFVGNAQQSDDLTMLAIRFNKA